VFDGQPFLNPTTFWYDPAHHELYFHSNVVGRMRANAEANARVCFEVFESGRFLPSNVALELSVQFASVIAFGTIRVLQDDADKERALYGLVQKYFPQLTVGELIRPITAKELKRTSVYAITIEEWSGKENWVEMAEQSDEWNPLPQPLLHMDLRE
jgi:nitroimidazol reductase NimA-like FMN-containing flavoprotein (pyridoxamine 5'-phosphate oxidase superfamily)